MSQVITIPLDTPIGEVNATAQALYKQALKADPDLTVLGGNRFLVSDEAAARLSGNAPARAAKATKAPAKKATAKRSTPRKTAAKKATAKKSTTRTRKSTKE